MDRALFRIADWHAPLRVNPNRSPGRFHRAGQLAVYACLHPLGPWAEFLRAEEPPEPLRAHFRHRLWALRLDLTDATIIDFDVAELWGIDPHDLVDDDHGACQGLADRLREHDITTVVVPSAALPGTYNVVIFEPRVASPWDAEIFDPVDVPVGMVADHATIPRELLGLVRFRGDPHGAYTAWANGQTFVFDDPVWDDWELPGDR